MIAVSRIWIGHPIRGQRGGRPAGAGGRAGEDIADVADPVGPGVWPLDPGEGAPNKRSRGAHLSFCTPAGSRFINTPLQRGVGRQPWQGNRFSGLRPHVKPLKRLQALRPSYTPLKRGVHETAANTGAYLHVQPLQELRCAQPRGRS